MMSVTFRSNQVVLDHLHVQFKCLERSISFTSKLLGFFNQLLLSFEALCQPLGLLCLDSVVFFLFFSASVGALSAFIFIGSIAAVYVLGLVKIKIVNSHTANSVIDQERLDDLRDESLILTIKLSFRTSSSA